MSATTTGHSPARDMTDLANVLHDLVAFLDRRRGLDAARRTQQPISWPQVATHLHKTAVTLAAAVDRGRHPLAQHHFERTMSQLHAVRTSAKKEGQELEVLLDPLFLSRYHRIAALKTRIEELTVYTMQGEAIPYHDEEDILREVLAVYELLHGEGGFGFTTADVERARENLDRHTARKAEA